ncbi:MAG: SGNH/GDSL hydrolase family protein, partial [Planctomycetes bacterium]|nr:SGNH/GDSL hydrolase family protein [Planctomycetota bacterium]
RSQVPEVLGRWSQGFATLVAAWTLVTLVALATLHGGFRARLVAKRAVLASLFSGLVLAVFMGEVLLRTLDPLGFNYYGEMQRYIQMRQEDDLLVYTQPADTEVVLDNTPIRYNSAGLRGPEIQVKQPGQKRVLFLGDSVVFGWGVREEYLFTNGVAERLTEQTGSTWSAINAGVCSYNTEQEELFLNERGFPLEPDLVVLVIIDNDVLTYSEDWKKEQAALRSPIRRLQRALRTSYLYRLVNHTLTQGMDGISLEGEERGVNPGTPGWESNMNALAGITRSCAERNVPLAIFHFRWVSGGWTDTYLESAREHAKPIPIIDTAPWFQDAPLIRWVNSPTDSHPNPQAHARATREMVREVLDQGILGER